MTSKKMEQPMCKNCVNFIETENDKIMCDYEYFGEMNYEDALLNVPELFDCDKFEDIRDLN